jgi:hypothetical protein
MFHVEQFGQVLREACSSVLLDEELAQAEHERPTNR